LQQRLDQLQVGLGNGLAGSEGVEVIPKRLDFFPKGVDRARGWGLLCESRLRANGRCGREHRHRQGCDGQP
jgi:hypothetical protein